jgi:hypothetical protein
MLDPIPPPALEEYLLETGIIDRSQLSLAKKLQHRQQGPLLMILLELSFIDLEQLSRLLDLGKRWIVFSPTGNRLWLGGSLLSRDPCC